jgi:uncharacterized protein YeaO (DUF488 family)
MIQMKRLYSEPGKQDGVRILVDRVWPRGFSKDRARIDEWRKELGPAPPQMVRPRFSEVGGLSGTLPKRAGRIRGNRGAQGIGRTFRHEAITLIYSAADEQHNQAVVLKAFLDELISAHAKTR